MVTFSLSCLAHKMTAGYIEDTSWLLSFSLFHILYVAPGSATLSCATFKQMLYFDA
eukprot:c56271_g1_i1 orf=3-167(-)